MDNHADQFKLVNLEERTDVMNKITEAEQEINRMLGDRVALIAYVKEQETGS